jgi:predicted transcriptional regulator
MTIVAGGTRGIGSRVVATLPRQVQEAVTDVGELTRPATSVEPEAHLAAAASLLQRSGASALVVRHGRTEPIGLLRAVDIVRAVAAGLDLERTRVRQIVGERARRVDRAVPIRVAARMMLSAGVEHLVVDGAHHTVGIVSLPDVCRSLVRSPTVAILLREPRTGHRPRRTRHARSPGPPEPIGPMVRRLRHRADLTLERLSQLSGISDRALSDIERGVARGPQHRTVLAISRALDLSDPDRAALFEAARAGRCPSPSSVSRSGNRHFDRADALQPDPHPFAAPDQGHQRVLAGGAAQDETGPVIDVDRSHRRRRTTATAGEHGGGGFRDEDLLQEACDGVAVEHHLVHVTLLSARSVRS